MGTVVGSGVGAGVSVAVGMVGEGTVVGAGEGVRAGVEVGGLGVASSPQAVVRTINAVRAPERVQVLFIVVPSVRVP